ncbi:hypothetical protein FOMPIDRAFT_1027212 [Fomitopsis schrenkii]|uniref:Carboxylic ester hydrolase n=1 Tax=Fomitopsis schrenkii TaxID=2126942 RepID=S8FWW6_FOMSC|nr:hypothetical protein FOMPIDRAFT_1027212 [Fomitopsis schrenkii]
MTRTLATLLAGLACLVPLSIAWQTDCESFTPEDAADVTLLGATYYPANATVDLATNQSTIDVANLPAFCRLQLQITTNTTANSTCYTEVWLPDDWNGRFLTVGNGGLAGGVDVAALGSVAVPQGFVGVGTDTGHTSGVGDGAWALGNDNAIIDYGWRALHLSIVAGKELTEQYYGQYISKSYYMGCSTGELKEAQSFPDDFDGIVVGSPANWLTHLQDWSAHISLDVLPAGGPRFINASTWIDVIHPEVLRQCDALDGLADGIINDPRVCVFRPETLACRPGQDIATCLTIPQIDALHKIYADYWETNQTWIFGPYYPGGETAYPYGLVATEPSAIPVSWFRYFITNDSSWTVEDYNPSLIELAEDINPGQSNAISPNLTAFAGSGRNGKLMHYVGWADQLISPGNSLHYYETAHAFMAADSELNIDDFYRLYTVPGMNHCAGGYGANAFGAVSQASSGMPPLSYDPQYNILAAMVQWVEEGIPPDTIYGVYWNDNNVTNDVGFIRPICQYPTMLSYIGGNETSPESFVCV